MVVSGCAAFCAASAMVRVIAALVLPLTILRFKLRPLPPGAALYSAVKICRWEGQTANGETPAGSPDTRAVRLRALAVTALTARRPLDDRDGDRRDPVFLHDDLAEREHVATRPLDLQLGGAGLARQHRLALPERVELDGVEVERRLRHDG